MKFERLIIVLALVCSLSQCSHAQTFRDWSQWIKSNSSSLSLSDTIEYSDLSFFKKVLKDKRIVLLGENSHGISEFTTLKSRMVRYLHDSLGFDVLAFESNMADAYSANKNISACDAQTSIYNSLSSLWHVREIVPLFNYIKRAKSTPRPLEVSGVDFIASNGSYSFARFLYNLILPIDPAYAKEVRETDSSFTRTAVRGWTIFRILTKEEKNEYYSRVDQRLSFYSKLLSFIETNKNKFPQAEKQDLAATKYFLHDRIDCLHWSIRDSAYMASRLPCIKHIDGMEELWDRYRDYVMGQHLRYLANELYPGRRIIVWAENGHIAKKECRMAAGDEVLKNSYSITFQSYSGQGCYVMKQKSPNTPPYREVYNYITPTDSLSIEKIMHEAGYKIAFVDMLYQTECKGNSWMFEKSESTGWAGDVIRQCNNIRNFYDGIILIDKISPPKYLKFEYEYLEKP